MIGAGTQHTGARGFTLIELAVALFIVTLLIGGVMIPLQTQIESRKLEETRRILDQAREALLGYAASFGHFPCPADGASNGLEPAGTNHADLTLPANPCPGGYHGFLPAALLGIGPVDSQGYAIDPWGSSATNRIRYAVSNHSVGGIANAFTLSGGIASAGIPSLGGANDLFFVCNSGTGVNPDLNCGAAQTLASNIVVVVWSVGQNGASGGASVHEAQNPNPNGGSADRIFVSGVRVTGGANEFDDIVSWISNFVVVTHLIAAGQLP